MYNTFFMWPLDLHTGRNDLENSTKCKSGTMLYTSLQRSLPTLTPGSLSIGPNFIESKTCLIMILLPWSLA